MVDRSLRIRVERLLRGDYRVDDVTRLLLYARDRYDGRPCVKEVGDFIAHSSERQKGVITNTVRDWVEIVKFFKPVFAEGGPYPVDGNKLPENTPAYLAASLSRADNTILKKFASMNSVKAKKVLPNLIKNLVKNNDRTFRISSSITSEQFDLLNCLATRMFVMPAFTGDRFFREFFLTLKSNGLVLGSEENDFGKIKIPICLYAVALMHNCVIKVDKDYSIKLDAHISSETGVSEERCITVSAFVPFRNSSMGASVFTVECDIEQSCEERLIIANNWMDFDLEVNEYNKLDVLG